MRGAAIHGAQGWDAVIRVLKDDPDPLRADYDGDLGDFGRVYLVPNAVAQVLAQVTCQDRKYPVRLLGKVDEPAKYVVSLPTSTLTFDALPGWKTHPAANIREWASKTHSPPALVPVTASHNPLCASQSDLGVKNKTQNLHTERVVAAPAPVVAGGRRRGHPAEYYRPATVAGNRRPQAPGDRPTWPGEAALVNICPSSAMMAFFASASRSRSGSVPATRASAGAAPP